MSEERVATAAIKVRGQVFTSRTHREAVFAAALALGVAPVTVWEELGREAQGFRTTNGRFVSRAEAYVIAKREGQLRLRWRREQIGQPELHSEDLV